MSDYLPIAVFFAFTLLFALGTLGLASFVRYRRPEPMKHETYECGEPAVGDAWIRFPVGYYLIALVFVIFDVEIAFLFPWAAFARELGMAGLGAIVLFVAVLFLGWVYAYCKGALEWE
jgi:NADH-quinone oxidoreductase subunit A